MNRINNRVAGNTELNDCVSMKKDTGYMLTLEPCSEMNNFVCEAPGKSSFFCNKPEKFLFLTLCTYLYTYIKLDYLVEGSDNQISYLIFP